VSISDRTLFQLNNQRHNFLQILNSLLQFLISCPLLQIFRQSLTLFLISCCISIHFLQIILIYVSPRPFPELIHRLYNCIVQKIQLVQILYFSISLLQSRILLFLKPEQFLTILINLVELSLHVLLLFESSQSFHSFVGGDSFDHGSIFFVVFSEVLNILDKVFDSSFEVFEVV
jgi:hypothetical protein